MRWSFPCRPGIRIPGFHLKLEAQWASDVPPVDLRFGILKKKKGDSKVWLPPRYTGRTSAGFMDFLWMCDGGCFKGGF